MKRPRWLLLLCVVALVGVAGCSDDDDVLTPPDVGTAAAAEGAINSALTDIVDPFLTVIELFDALTAPPPAPMSRGGLSCPIVSGICTSGNLTCTPGGTDLTFGASSCSAFYDGSTILIDGTLAVLPSISSTLFTFTSFSANSSSPISGTVTLDQLACSTAINVAAVDGTTLSGLLIDCTDDNPDAGSNLTIVVDVSGVGMFTIVFTFDNTSVAAAAVSLNGTPAAACSVDLNALVADCVDL